MLRDADLAYTYLRHASLRNTDLTGANVWKADWSAVDAEGACFRGAKVSRAWFYRSNFRGADFSGCTMLKTSFLECDLRGGDFCDVRLNRTRLVEARLAGARFDGAEGSILDLPCDVSETDDPELVEGDALREWLLAAGAARIELIAPLPL